MKKIIAAAAALMLGLAALSPVAGQALSFGGSYMYDADGRSYRAPAFYRAEDAVYGQQMGAGALDRPQDLFVAGEGDGAQIVIADTGNDRIVVTDAAWQVQRLIEGGIDAAGQLSPLSEPHGVCVGADGLLYIADTGNERVIALDGDGRIRRELRGEGLTSVNENFRFKPRKVAADRDGSVYVVSPDIYQGIVRFEADDSFAGFFAPNEIEVTLAVRIAEMWKERFSEEQQDKLEKTLPQPYNNLYLAADRFIYTTAENVAKGSEIKRLGALGVNTLRTPRGGTDSVAFGDRESSYEDGALVESSFLDVHCDADGLMCALDGTRGRLFLYDGECDLLGIFGGKTAYGGTLSEPVALDKCGSRYLVLDAAAGCVTPYVPTDHACDVLEALADYAAGDYAACREKWMRVLDRDANYVLARRSIGRALLQQGDSAAAMTMLKAGDDEHFYSLALKERRKVLLRRYGWLILPAAATAVAIPAVIRRGRRKRKKEGKR